jgi:amino acid adenylation domain-containing protein/thioester reductase-like protein
MKKNMPNPIPNHCIHQLFEIQVEKTPDAIAVIFEERQLTYRELNEKANQLAHYLQQLGVKPETLVGICVERSLEMIVALIGILKAGGAYVPLDVSYPVDRLSFMIENSQASILLTQSYLVKQLPDTIEKKICLDLEQAEISKHSINNLDNHVVLENLAYVIYTSGSTGKPKGVAMPHAPLCNLLNWQATKFCSNFGSKTIQYTPISFDVSFQEIFSTLIVGGILVLITEEERRNPFSLLKFLRCQEIERLFLPFVALRQLAEATEKENQLPLNLKEVITAGEQLRITSSIIQWFEKMPNCTLHNHYGPSESHVVTSFTLKGSPKDWTNLPPIGSPIINTRIYILDSQLQSVPEGEVGELYISGSCLARGYLNQPELTDERFILNPLIINRQEKFYKTGDLARYLPDGNIEYLGRVDRQVKIRGYRVETGEIEAVLEQHHKVREAVVIAVESKPEDKRKHILGDKRLVVYVLPETETVTIRTSFSEIPFTRELRQFLQQKLPEYMIPSAFMFVKEFPLTPSGKIDHHALPTPKWTRMEEGVYIAPSNPLEKGIADIWYQILGLDLIGIHDNFYELGGHSLSSMKMINIVSEAFKVPISFKDFLDAPTIINLAKLVNSLLTGNTINKLIDIEQDTELDPSIYPQSIFKSNVPQIFLTGATGFLGSFLLVELINKIQGNIHCLVRASSLEEGRANIKNSLKHYDLWNDSLNSKIVPVLGDLRQPQLGIDSKQFALLAEQIDVIYHCGASVNLLYPYSALKSANVFGTQEILRLASQFKVKPVHFISTVDVFSSLNYNEIRIIDPEDSIGPSNHLYSGYAQSKYVAEKLIINASSRGILCNIYRPSNIIGNTSSGISQQNSFINLMMQGCLQMGFAPDLDCLINLVPVDYASKLIVYLSQNYHECSQAFNIVNPQGIEWKQLINWSIEQGCSLDIIPYEAWYAKLIELSKYSSSNVLSPIISIFTNQNFVKKILGIFDFCDNSLINNLDIACPQLDDQLLNLYFSDLFKISDSSIPEQFLAHCAVD